MDNTTNYEFDEWLEDAQPDDRAKENRRSKKRRRPLRKNRKPSRPITYIGQRSNNHLLKMFTEH